MSLTLIPGGNLQTLTRDTPEHPDNLYSSFEKKVVSALTIRSQPDPSYGQHLLERRDRKQVGLRVSYSLLKFSLTVREQSSGL